MPSPSHFLTQVGPPPKVRIPQPSKQPEQMPEDEPTAPLEELDLPLEGDAQQASVAQVLLKQQMALNTLVSHIASQDGLRDLGGSGSASSTISLKVSARRDRLLADLAARKSEFFLKVVQNAHRRLRLTEMVPSTLADFPQKALFTKYLERQGGYTGFQRDQGLTMWLLGHVADQLLLEDVKGAREMLALAMVAIEQSAMDNGKWEVAWILSLQEDPPQQLFAHRPPATNPRLRAFGPLCPADWGATCQCERAGLAQHPPCRSPTKETRRRKARRRAGRSRQKTQAAQVPQEAKSSGRPEPSRKHMKHASQGQAKPSPVSDDVPFVGQSCPRSWNVDFSPSCRANGFSADDSLPTRSSLQTFSFLRWTSSLCHQVLSSCTPFASFLKWTLHIARSSEVASAKVLFPLPLPKVGVFHVSKGAGSRERRRKAFDQAVHITVMALNFRHADFKFPP